MIYQDSFSEGYYNCLIENKLEDLIEKERENERLKIEEAIEILKQINNENY